MQANSGDPDQTPRLVWVCTICLCPTKRSLHVCLHGLISRFHTVILIQLSSLALVPCFAEHVYIIDCNSIDPDQFVFLTTY